MKFPGIFFGIFLWQDASALQSVVRSSGIQHASYLSVSQQNLVEEPSTKEEDGKNAVPYAIARGDGSTGGGGLPMPKSDNEDGLKRPKVGAEMPNG